MPIYEKKHARKKTKEKNNQAQAEEENDVSEGDLLYGVNSDMGRKWYAQYREPFKSRTLTIDDLPILRCDHEPQARYASHTAEFMNFLSSHEKYKSAIGAEFLNEAIRRKSKGGIEWAVNSARSVHFVLDDLNLSSVIEKSYSGKNRDRVSTSTEPKNRAITGSELRWVYRNRDDPKVKSKVVFWQGGEKISAPWDQSVVSLNIKDGQPLETTYDKDEWKKYK